MSEVAFLFPGQGSQSVGMVRELAAFPETMQFFEKARRILGFDLFDLCLFGPEKKLSQDLNAQLAVYVTNCVYAALLNRMGLHPKLASGFSLGIFSALVSAGSLDFEQGLEGVRAAAEKMSAEGRRYQGAMAAVIGLSRQEVGAACEEAPGSFVASMNTARQIVIAGQEKAVEKVLALCMKRGALLTKPLDISWAIHTPLMKGASESFSRVIADWKIRAPRFPVLSYLRAEFLRTSEEIKEELAMQFSRPNCWHQVLLRMLAEGTRIFIEAGPGHVLSQMVRWVDRQAKTISAEDILKGTPLPLIPKKEPEALWN